MQQQEIPISAEEDIGTSSNGNISFFNQEMELAHTVSEIEEKFELVVEVEKEISTLMESLTTIMGVSFMHRIVENPVWAEGHSQEFDAQFLHPEVPAVVNIATLVKRAHILKEEYKELTQRLEKLGEGQRHKTNGILPLH